MQLQCLKWGKEHRHTLFWTFHFTLHRGCGWRFKCRRGEKNETVLSQQEVGVKRMNWMIPATQFHFGDRESPLTKLWNPLLDNFQGLSQLIHHEMIPASLFSCFWATAEKGSHLRECLWALELALQVILDAVPQPVRGVASLHDCCHSHRIDDGFPVGPPGHVLVFIDPIFTVEWICGVYYLGNHSHAMEKANLLLRDKILFIFCVLLRFISFLKCNSLPRRKKAERVCILLFSVPSGSSL